MRKRNDLFIIIPDIDKALSKNALSPLEETPADLRLNSNNAERDFPCRT